jgi:hypothetical protein
MSHSSLSLSASGHITNTQKEMARAGGASIVYRRNKYLPRTALGFVATLPLFYISLHSSREMHIAPENQFRYQG